jgi:hypothetical protein
MPGREEIVHSLIGAWRLARLDPQGMNQFDLSFTGFWHSFFAALLVAPGYAILVAQRFSTSTPNAPEAPPSVVAFESQSGIGWIILVQAVSYLVSWAAFPVLAGVITWILNLSRNYVALIVAANWAAVIQICAFLIAVLLGAAFPRGLASLIITVVTMGILFYQWFVTRTALQTTAGIALALVLANLLVNTAINLTADRLI